MEKLFVEKKAVIGIIGLGYVGLPLALAACNEKISVVGFDIDPEKASKHQLPARVTSNIFRPKQLLAR